MCSYVTLHVHSFAFQLTCIEFNHYFPHLVMHTYSYHLYYYIAVIYTYIK